MKKAVIVSAVRTPIGSFGGAFASLSAVDLGVVAAKEAIKRAGIEPSLIDEAYFGNVLSAGLGQNVARQVSLGSRCTLLKTSINYKHGLRFRFKSRKYGSPIS